MTTAHEAAEVNKIFAIATKVAKFFTEEGVDTAMGVTLMTFMISSAIALIAARDQVAADALQAKVIHAIVDGRVAISNFVTSPQETA